MTHYHCVIPQCPYSKIVSTERKAVFRHYLTHLISDLEDAVSRFRIVTFHDNRLSLINVLIEFSKVTVNQK